jgi:hypothetical protein
VRCGTTTLCAHLAALGRSGGGFAPPFCPWKHPELDGKETFYFAGHFLGLVDPRLYPMCFPPSPHTTLASLVGLRARLSAAAAELRETVLGRSDGSSSSSNNKNKNNNNWQWTFDGYPALSPE